MANAYGIYEEISEIPESTISEIKVKIRYLIDNNLDELDGFVDFNITTYVLLNLTDEVLAENPQYFYLSVENFRASYSSNFYKETGLKVAKKLKAAYPENMQEQIDFVSGVADEIIAGIDNSMNDVEKAHYVHEYLINNYAYDTRIHDGDPAMVRDLYEFFKQKVGIFQAYTIAFQYIMQYKLGIPVTNVASYEMNHTWNVIQLNGQWYHVDITRDDPEPDGQLLHDYFIKSDSYMINHGYSDWIFTRNHDVVCSDTSYDDYIWHSKKKNIRRNSGAETPDKIYRCVNGQLVEPDKIYKCINGELVLFWEK